MCCAFGPPVRRPVLKRPTKLSTVLIGLRGVRSYRLGCSSDARSRVSSSFSRESRCLTECLFMCGHVQRIQLLWLASGGCTALAAIGSVAGSSEQRQPTIGSLLWPRATRGYHQRCLEAACTSSGVTVCWYSKALRSVELRSLSIATFGACRCVLVGSRADKAACARRGQPALCL